MGFMVRVGIFGPPTRPPKPKLDIFYAANYSLRIISEFIVINAYHGKELFRTKSVSFWFQVDYGVTNLSLIPFK